MTDALLTSGIATTVAFIVVLLVEGARRPGYNPTYHTGSELELDGGGWVQRLNFFFAGAGLLAYAVGVIRALDDAAAAALLAVAAVGLVVAGIFTPDPIRGYPPGSPTGGSDQRTRHHRVHHAAGPVSFIALLGACLALAGELDGAWRAYTLTVAVLGLAFTVWTARAFQRDAAKTGLIQRGLIATYFSWIVVLGFHLVGVSPAT